MIGIHRPGRDSYRERPQLSHAPAASLEKVTLHVSSLGALSGLTVVSPRQPFQYDPEGGSETAPGVAASTAQGLDTDSVVGGGDRVL